MVILRWINKKRIKQIIKRQVRDVRVVIKRPRIIISLRTLIYNKIKKLRFIGLTSE